MSEKRIMQEIQVELAKIGVRLFRNNSGVLQDRNGTYVRYGLCNGSSDLIGIAIPSGRMVAIEVKSINGRATAEQASFIDFINSSGGIAFVARSVEEARHRIMEKL